MTVSTQAIPPQRDFQGCFLRESLWLQYDFFAFKTLERAYLLKLDNKIAERPQHMIMRVACGVHGKGVNGPVSPQRLAIYTANPSRFVYVFESPPVSI